MNISVFFVPIRGNSSAIVELADNYCNLGNRVANVISEGNSPKGKIHYYKIYDEPQSLLSTVLKIVSYIVLLGIPWLIACAIKAHHRYHVNYQEIPPVEVAPGTKQSPPTISEGTSREVSDPIEGVLHPREKVPEQLLVWGNELEGSRTKQSPPTISEGTSIEVSDPIERVLHPMEKVQEQLLAWWNETDGTNQFKNRDTEIPINPDLVSKLQQLAMQETACPKKEIVLLFQSFRFGFRFYYARMPENKKFLPMPWAVGVLLDMAKERNISLPWFTIDPATKSQVIVNVQKCETLYPPNGSMPTRDYLIDLITDANNRESKEFCILEALLPYAFNVKEELDNGYYARLRGLIPAFPENPVRSK